jgi:hypothetical protein
MPDIFLRSVPADANPADVRLFATASGTAALSLGDLTTTSAGVVAVNGAASLTLDPLTVTSAGLSGGSISGTAALTLAALTAAGVGAVAVQGASSLTLGVLTVSAAGVVAVQGAGALTLGALTVTSAGTVAVQGSASLTLGAVTVSSAGVELVAGAASLTLGSFTSSAAGGVAVRGAASMTLGALTLTAGSTAPAPVAAVGSSRYRIELIRQRAAYIETGRAAWRKIAAIGSWGDLSADVASAVRAFSRGPLDVLPAAENVLFDAWSQWRPEVFGRLGDEVKHVERRVAEARQKAWVAQQEQDARRAADKRLRDLKAAVAMGPDDEEAALMLLLS